MVVSSFPGEECFGSNVGDGEKEMWLDIVNIGMYSRAGLRLQ